MTDPDNSYRPRSPDFSSFQGASASFSSSSSPFAQQPPSYGDPYIHHPSSPGLTSPVTPQASYDASPFFNPNPQVARQQYFPPQQQQQQQQPYWQHQYQQQQPFSSYQPFGAVPPVEMPPQTRSRTQAAQPQIPQPQQQEPQQQQQQLQTQHQSHPQLHWQQPSEPPPKTASDRGPSQGIEIRTKFPVARIKRIMQADEDVGKVAQVTPIAVSKALELFMISLVSKASQQARDRSSKRVTAVHLKDAIAKDEVLDFLADIIAKVPDQSSGGGRHHHHHQEEDGSDHHQRHQNERGRKRGGRSGGGGRRKKAGDDDDL